MPTDKIVARYYRSMALIRDLMAVSDELSVYDNSTDRYRLVYQQKASSYYLSPELENKPWVMQYILPYISP